MRNKIQNTGKYSLLVLMLMITFSANAQTQLSSLFKDHMVLQQNTAVSVWGTDVPNTKVVIKTDWGEGSVVRTDKNGSWFAKIKTLKASYTPYQIKVKGTSEVVVNDVLLGEVWLCSGQSNMEISLKGNPGQPIYESNHAIATSNNKNLRVFKVAKAMDFKEQGVCEGEWKVSSPQTTADFSATTYFFGRMLQEQLGIPVGLINSSFGATPAEAWTPMKTLKDENLSRVLSAYKNTKDINRKTPSVLFNAMIKPLIPYTIKGAIWYQGESNKKHAKEYETLFPAMIQSWRVEWGLGDFPFYFVQLASLGWAKKDWVALQQAQLKTFLSVKNTGMVVTNDIGSVDCIHPPKKKEVGERLAYWALGNNYGFTGVEYCGPIYKSKKIEGGKIILTFDYAPGGITSMGKGFKDIEIAGEDNKYYQAEAKVTKQGKLMVWSNKVVKPLKVRYGLKGGYMEGSLYNTAGLPASGFSTE
ncbi:sialate O-acetylesterase [Wenyingzhuangia sp. IMCC45574]